MQVDAYIATQQLKEKSKSIEKTKAIKLELNSIIVFLSVTNATA